MLRYKTAHRLGTKTSKPTERLSEIFKLYTYTRRIFNRNVAVVQFADFLIVVFDYVTGKNIWTE